MQENKIFFSYRSDSKLKIQNKKKKVNCNYYLFFLYYSRIK